MMQSLEACCAGAAAGTAEWVSESWLQCCDLSVCHAENNGVLTWALMQKLKPAVLVQLVVEPSGAVGLAAVLSPSFQQHERWGKLQRVGIVLCGGNVDLEAAGLWRALLSRESLSA